MRVYVNWNDEDILTAKQYDNLAEEKAMELEEDKDAFEEWLNRNYNASDLWNADETTKWVIKDEWHMHCWDEVSYDLSKDYDKYDIEED